MKTPLFLKALFVLPIIVFVDYVLMVLIGHFTCLVGCGEQFYCQSYAICGFVVTGASALLFGAMMYPDVQKILKISPASRKMQE
ncbi:MAG: hypothetical protein RIS47_1214 [Bacteroidota bacterium]|jgi:hypothetical protein